MAPVQRERERERVTTGFEVTSCLASIIIYCIRRFTLQLGISELCCAAEQPYSGARVWLSDAVHSDIAPARTRLGLEYHHTKERAPYRPSITQNRRAAWLCTVARGSWLLQAS